MNLKSYLESDVIDFELRENVISEYEKLFDKDKGIRSYMTFYASYLIYYTEKTVIMTSIFEENYKELKAFKFVCEHYGFKFEVSLLDFVNLPKKDNIIQTIKFHVTTELVLKNPKKQNNYHQLINSKEVIETSKKRFNKYLTLKEYNDFSIIAC